MSLSPRAIALQGIGFGVLPLAVQGFAAVDATVIKVVVTGGGGGGAHGVDPGKELTTLFSKGAHDYLLPSREFEDEERIRAEIIREDEEILMVIMSAITTGAMKKWLH